MSAGKLPRPQPSCSFDAPLGTKRSRRSSKESGVEAALVSLGRTDISGHPLHLKQDASSLTMTQHPRLGGLEEFTQSQLSSSSMEVPITQHTPTVFLGYNSGARAEFAQKGSEQVTGSASGDATMLYDSLGIVPESYPEPDSSFLFPDAELQPAFGVAADARNGVSQSQPTYPEGVLGPDMLDIWTTAPVSFE